MEIKHSTTANPNEIVASTDWNANHTIDDITTSVNVTFVGTLAGSGATGNEPFCIGYRAGVNNSGNDNTFIGNWAGDTSAGHENVFVGYSSGWESTGTRITALGFYAALECSGELCTFIGINAGESSSGDNCIGIGRDALSLNSGNNVVAIGEQAGLSNTVSNQFIVKQTSVNATPLIQGDFSTGNIAIGKTSAKSKLGVAGLPVYANNAAAIVGGLAAGDFYRTGADPDPLMVVH